ncbi:hypothetical protein BJY52DRAFT_1194016 [Lactarius psammicola]|nr:hypothetical protein BJY52DRAFT_1194016 [Lactarius psammicola]
MSRAPSRKSQQVSEAIDSNTVHLSQAPRFPRALITSIKTIPRRIYQKGRNAQRALIYLHDKPRERKEPEQSYVTAQTLPDDVLFQIFHCHRLASIRSGPWKWHRLAQVCRRWRFIVFANPRHLNLRVVSTYNKSIRETPDFWPALPIVIWYPRLEFHPSLSAEDEDNISDILKDPVRICEMHIDLTRSLLDKCVSSLVKSFPALEDLRLGLRSDHISDNIVLPDNFLDNSTPLLRVIHLRDTAVPMLPRLLSSSNNLVSLRVKEIKSDGYFIAEDLAIGLSAATRLKYLELDYYSVPTHPLRRGDSVPLSSRIVLPSLTEFRYRGKSVNLMNFVSRIDAPIIEEIWVSLFRDIQYDTHELCAFFGRGEGLRPLRHRTMYFGFLGTCVVFEHRFSDSQSFPGIFSLLFSSHYDRPLDHDVFLVNQICAWFESRHILPEVTRLDIEGRSFPSLSRWHNETDAEDWLNLLRPLTGVTRLKVVGTLVSCVVSALAQVTGETTREILPALQDLHFGPYTPISTPESIRPFITARKLYGLPISVHYCCNGCWSERFESSG